MKPLAFFHDAAVTELLERAATAGAMPLSVHFLEQDEEGMRVAGHGACAACRHVNNVPGGRKACRASRMAAEVEAQRRGGAYPFQCHMGFTCITAPALPDDGYMITLGPYTPAGSSEALEYEAARRLALLDGETHESFPVPLADIRPVPLSAPKALLAWTLEALAGLWEEAQSAESPVLEEGGTAQAPLPRRAQRPQSGGHDPYAAAEVAAAIAGGNQPQARALLAGVLRECAAPSKKRLIPVQRARLAAAVGAALEKLEHAALDTAPGWEAMSGLPGGLQTAASEAELLDASMAVLGPIRRRAERGEKRAATGAAPSAMNYAELNRIVNERLPESVSLEAVAVILGESATTISHRLRRKFGMSYSEYVGRLRIARAKELLRETRLSATEVAQRIGVRDQSNFSKLFRKYEGISPRTYQARFRK